MTVGRCVVAVALSSFTFPLCVDAVREEAEDRMLEVHSRENSTAFIGCVVPSTKNPQRSLTFEAKVGFGAEGGVYKAKDQSGKYAAVKVLRQGKSLDVKEVANLEALSKVSSKHINNLEKDFEDVRSCCGSPCLVTEFIAGKDAAKIMWENGIRTIDDVNQGKARRGALSYKLLRSILLQSLTGFWDTEKAKLCNSDQHLRNVMFEEATERIVFIDFGFARSPIENCPPTDPFKDESNAGRSLLQSFSSLAYLLADDGDKTAYLELCKRLAGKTYVTAKQALFTEAFASYPYAASKPGAFFNLHPDHIITQQLQALLDTGSPHIGKVSGKGPWEDAVETGQTLQPVRQQVLTKQLPWNPSLALQHIIAQTKHEHQVPQKLPSDTVVSREECCCGGACILPQPDGRCLDKKNGYQIDSLGCVNKFQGEWCDTIPQKVPSDAVVRREDCCRGGACILPDGRCFDIKHYHPIEPLMCVNNFHGEWCN